MSAAGPSGAGNDAHGKTVEETEELFEMGVACIKTGALEMALDIFAQVLRARTSRYGDLALECASSYYRYGAVLLYQAQDNADVFGANLDTDVHQDVEDKENDQVVKDQTVDADAELALALAAEDEPQDRDQPDQAAVDAPEITDLEVAWENLDCARAIWERDPQSHQGELAAVHVLLGDVAQENEAFEDSLTDYQQALMYQKMAGYDAGDRRTAEVYFKRVMALQFLERPEEALVEVENAKKVLQTRLEAIKGVEDSASEVEDVTAILEDLMEKRTELEALAEEKKAMTDAVRGALSKIAQQQEGSQGDHSLAPTANKSNIASPVKDLGVVGRGTKRIKLEPAVAVETKTEGEDPPPREAGTESRKLEDVLDGGKGGDTTIGF